MPPPLDPKTPRLRRPAALLAAAAGLALLAGCDVHENADLGNGKQLFAEKCGACHVLAEAGTKGTQGPDLDAAFAQARRDGMDRDTIEGVVERQIKFAQGGQMPVNLVRGQAVEDVAAYVASVAGKPGIKTKPVAGGGEGPGAQLFASQGCGSCHTLKAAGTSATIGPDLDQTLKGRGAAYVRQSIADPDAKLATGFARGIMPSDYGRKLSPKDLKALVDFILKSVKAG